MKREREAEGRGRTVEEAIDEALSQVQAVRDEVDVEVLEEPSRALFGLLGGHPARVRVRVIEHEDPKSAAAKAFLLGILQHFGLSAEIAEVWTEEGSVTLALSGDGLGMLIGRRGQTLDALQYLVNAIANKESRDGQWVRFLLDIDGYRERRAQGLVEMATRAAEEAARTGRPVALEPMNPYERRLVHVALQDMPGVETRSEGEEPRRRVVVLPGDSR